MGDDETAAVKHQLFGLTCRYLADMQRYELFPQLAAGTTVEIEHRWQLRKAGQAYESAWQQLSSQEISPEWYWLNAFLHHIVRTVPKVRMIVEHSRSLAKPEAHQDRVAHLLSPWLNFRGSAAQVVGFEPYVAYTDFACADMLQRAGFQQEAASFLEKAHQLYEQTADQVGIANCFLLLGDWAVSGVGTPAVWNHLIVEGTFTNALSWVRERQEFDTSSFNVEQARHAWRAALNHFTAANAPRGIGMVDLRFGYLAMLGGRYEEAETRCQQASNLLQTAGDCLAWQQARILTLCSQIGHGLRPVDRTIIQEVGDWGRQQGSFSYAIGLGILLAREGRRWLIQQGDFRRALVALQLAEKLFLILEASDSATQVQYDIADAHRTVGNQIAAFDNMVQVRDKLAVLIHLRPAQKTIYWEKAIQVADTLCAMAQNSQAPDRLERSIAQLEKLKAAEPAPPSGSLLGENFADTLPALITMRRRFAEVLVPLYRALIALKTGNEDEATDYFATALHVAQQEASYKDFLQATVLRVEKRYDEAVEAYKRYLSAGGTVTDFSGQIANRLSEQYGPAAAPFREDRKQVNHQFAAHFFTNCQYFAEALAHLNKIEAVHGAAWWLLGDAPWETAALYGRIYEGLQKYEKAISFYKRAIELLEKRQRTIRRDANQIAFQTNYTVQTVYFYAARTVARAWLQSLPQEKARYAEKLVQFTSQGRARALLQMLARSEQLDDRQQAVTATMRAVETELMLQQQLLTREQQRQAPEQERVKMLRAKITAGEEKMQRLETDLMAIAPQFVSSALIDLQEIQQRIGAGVLILQYYFMDNDLLVWGIAADRFAVHHAACDVKKLARDSQTLHHRLANRQPYEELAKRLSQLLLAPLSEMISKAQKLILIPYEALFNLPFCTLPLQGQPLIETHTIAYLPTISLLSSSEGATIVKRERLVSVGNPTNVAHGVAPLPAAEAEAQMVAALFEEGSTLIGSAATKEAVMKVLPQADIIHFATHGVLDEVSPLQSAILLANGQVLTVFELMGLNLKARLAVLSACDTGRGEATSGGELLGLLRGLFAASIPQAVVTLWPVEDVATSILMIHFYEQLLTGADAAVALRCAQQFVRTRTAVEVAAYRAEITSRFRHLTDENSSAAIFTPDWQHPAYWAPFTINQLL